jgi:hypothetical protein
MHVGVGTNACLVSGRILWPSQLDRGAARTGISVGDCGEGHRSQAAAQTPDQPTRGKSLADAQRPHDTASHVWTTRHLTAIGPKELATGHHVQSTRIDKARRQCISIHLCGSKGSSVRGRRTAARAERACTASHFPTQACCQEHDQQACGARTKARRSSVQRRQAIQACQPCIPACQNSTPEQHE